MQFTEQHQLILVITIDCIVVGKKGSSNEFLLIYHEVSGNNKGINLETSSTNNKSILMSAEKVVEMLRRTKLLTNASVEYLRSATREHRVLQFITEASYSRNGFLGESSDTRVTLEPIFDL